jgi:hypothetical protein
MNTFAHILDDLSPYVLGLFIALGLLGWLYGFTARVWPSRRLMKWEPEDSSIRFVLGLFVFGAVIGSIFLFNSIIKSAALEEIRPRLSSRIESISINGKPFERVEELAPALRGIRHVGAHHSDTVKEYDLRIQTEQGSLNLTLCRDSENPHEYWVFYDGFHSTLSGEIGRTYTDVLDTE